MLLDSNMQIIKGLPTRATSRLNNSKMSNESQDSRERERERAGESLNSNANSERPHCEIIFFFYLN